MCRELAERQPDQQQCDAEDVDRKQRLIGERRERIGMISPVMTGSIVTNQLK